MAMDTMGESAMLMTMSRRSRKPKAAELPPSVQRGLESLVEGHADTIQSMLDADDGAWCSWCRWCGVRGDGVRAMAVDASTAARTYRINQATTWC